MIGKHRQPRRRAEDFGQRSPGDHPCRRRDDYPTIKRKLDRNFWSMIIAISFLLAGGIAEYGVVTHQNSLRRDAQIAQCKRLQTHRDLDNQTNATIRAALASAALVIDDPRRLSRLSRSEAAQARLAAQALALAAKRILYAPATNCALAIDQPDTYNPPPPRPF